MHAPCVLLLHFVSTTAFRQGAHLPQDAADVAGVETGTLKGLVDENGRIDFIPFVETSRKSSSAPISESGTVFQLSAGFEQSGDADASLLEPESSGAAAASLAEKDPEGAGAGAEKSEGEAAAPKKKVAKWEGEAAKSDAEAAQGEKGAGKAKVAQQHKLVPVDKVEQVVEEAKRQSKTPEVENFAEKAAANLQNFNTLDLSKKPELKQLYKKEATVYATLAKDAAAVSNAFEHGDSRATEQDKQLLYDYATTLQELHVVAEMRKDGSQREYPEYQAAEALNALMVKLNAVGGYSGYSKFRRAFGLDKLRQLQDVVAVGTEVDDVVEAAERVSKVAKNNAPDGYRTYFADKCIELIRNFKAATKPADKLTFARQAQEYAILSKRAIDGSSVGEEKKDSVEWKLKIEAYAKALITLENIGDDERVYAAQVISWIREQNIQFKMKDAFVNRFAEESNELGKNEKKTFGKKGLLSGVMGIASTSVGTLGKSTGLA